MQVWRCSPGGCICVLLGKRAASVLLEAVVPTSTRLHAPLGPGFTVHGWTAMHGSMCTCMHMQPIHVRNSGTERISVTAVFAFFPVSSTAMVMVIILRTRC